MSRLGRILVFVNLALSLIFVAWSVGLYSQQVPWKTYRTSDGETVRGRIDVLKEDVQHAVEARDRAEARYLLAHADLLRLDQELPKRRAFFDEQLKLATTGIGADGKPDPHPVRRPKLEGELVGLDRTKWPVQQVGGKDALSYQGYRDALHKTSADLQFTVDETKKQVSRTTELTTEIEGTKPFADAYTAAEKGLRGQLRDARTLRRNALLEGQYLQTPITNYKVELELLQRRGEALEARLKEVGGSTRTARQ